jgi:Na+-translocating ferredoxin:NAD+ oxidoreductase RnfC subunit
MTVSIEKPLPPADDDCCGGGACNPCVWDYYYEEVQKWRIEQAKIREQQAQSSVILPSLT